MEQLRAEIRRLDHLYYVEAKPAVSDLQYDRMLEELKRLEKTSIPNSQSPDSPTQRVGDAPVDHLVQVPHQVPMLSIDNTYSREELQAYFDRTEKLLDGGTDRVGDGVQDRRRRRVDSIRARARLTHALTRGNGTGR